MPTWPWGAIFSLISRRSCPGWWGTCSGCPPGGRIPSSWGPPWGGYGALKAALTFPEKYGACGAFSPACLDMKRYMREEWKDGRDADAFRRAFGKHLKTDFDAAFGPGAGWTGENDLLWLAQQHRDVPEKPRIFTIWGEKDIFAATCRPFPGQLRDLGWEAEGKELPGMEHNWRFFSHALEEGIKALM